MSFPLRDTSPDRVPNCPPTARPYDVEVTTAGTPTDYWSWLWPFGGQDTPQQEVGG